MIKVKFSKENEKVKLPTKREGDAGRDLYLDPMYLENMPNHKITIKPLETAIIPTGLRSILPVTHYAQLQERGSTGIKAMKFGAGVVDSNYRGIWNVIITNCSNKTIVITDNEENCNKDEVFYPSNKAIAQFVFLEVPKVDVEEVSPEEIVNEVSERGEGKFGSSNK